MRQRISAGSKVCGNARRWHLPAAGYGVDCTRSRLLRARLWSLHGDSLQGDMGATAWGWSNGLAAVST
jgi:hypothetical protein